jgi:hypothetical protein
METIMISRPLAFRSWHTIKPKVNGYGSEPNSFPIGLGIQLSPRLTGREGSQTHAQTGLAHSQSKSDMSGSLLDPCTFGLGAHPSPKALGLSPHHACIWIPLLLLYLYF